MPFAAAAFVVACLLPPACALNIHAVAAKPSPVLPLPFVQPSSTALFVQPSSTALSTPSLCCDASVEQTTSAAQQHLAKAALRLRGGAVSFEHDRARAKANHELAQRLAQRAVAAVLSLRGGAVSFEHDRARAKANHELAQRVAQRAVAAALRLRGGAASDGGCPKLEQERANDELSTHAAHRCFSVGL